MSQSDIIDLDALVRPVARVKLLGHEYDVMPASGRAAELLDQVAVESQKPAAERKQIVLSDVQREIVRECVPSFSIDDYGKLNVDQVNAIIALATKQQDRVRAMIAEHEGNAKGP